MVVAADKGSDRVDGRFNPGKDVNNTLTVWEAMMYSLLFGLSIVIIVVVNVGGRLKNMRRLVREGNRVA